MRYLQAFLRAVSSVPPDMRARVIRHVITLLAGVGLFRGLTADKVNAWQGLVELGLSAIGFGLAVYLSARSDAKQAASPLTEEEIDALVREVSKDRPLNLAGRDIFANDNPNPSPAGPAPAIQTRPPAPPTGGVQ